MLTKQEADRMMKIKGEVRGESLKADLDFVIEKKGKEGLKKIESKMEELGYPLKYKDLKPMGFYPIGLSGITLPIIKETFNFAGKDLEKWGRSVVKFSILMKIFMKYFTSLDLIAKQIPSIWQKHYTIGSLEMVNFSKKDRYVVLKLKDFKISPLHCNIYKGYFSKVTEMVVKHLTICKETKCMFKGDPYHEFLLTW